MKDGRARTPGERICQRCGKSRPISEMQQSGGGHWNCKEHPPEKKRQVVRDGEATPHYDPNWGPMPI